MDLLVHPLLSETSSDIVLKFLPKGGSVSRGHSFVKDSWIPVKRMGSPLTDTPKNYVCIWEGNCSVYCLAYSSKRVFHKLVS